MEIEEVKKEKVCIVVLSALSRYENVNLINIQLAVETLLYLKRNEMPILFSVIVSKKVAENIRKLGNLNIEMDSLKEYAGVTSVCEEIFEVCLKMKKNKLSKYILIVQKDLLISAKKFMDNYGLEMVDIVSVSGGNGLRLNFFLLKNTIVEKVKSFLTILNKKQNLPI